jgi:hypothetical protein
MRIRAFISNTFEVNAAFQTNNRLKDIVGTLSN